MSYRFIDSFRAGRGWNFVPSWSCSKTVYKPVWHLPLLSVQWVNSWWWTDELSETYRVSLQNKFVKLVHLVGFITKIFEEDLYQRWSWDAPWFAPVCEFVIRERTVATAGIFLVQIRSFNQPNLYSSIHKFAHISLVI